MKFSRVWHRSHDFPLFTKIKFSRVWHRSHDIPLFTQVKFSRVWLRFHDFPHLAQVKVFRVWIRLKIFSRCTQIRASVPWSSALYTSWVFPRLAFFSRFPALYCAIHKRKLVFLRLGNGPTFSSAVHWLLYFCLRLVLISCFPAPCTSYVFPCLALLTRFCVQFWLVYYVVFVCCDWSDGITMF